MLPPYHRALAHETASLLAPTPCSPFWLRGSGAFHPPVRIVVPPWILGFVLTALCEAPHGPLRQASPAVLSGEVVFLLAIPSASRMSELHVSSRFNPLLAVLTPPSAFRPTTVTAAALDSCAELQAFYPYPMNALH